MKGWEQLIKPGYRQSGKILLMFRSDYFRKAPITREYEDLGHEITGSQMAKLPRGMAKKRMIKIMRNQSENFFFIANSFKVNPADLKN